MKFIRLFETAINPLLIYAGPGQAFMSDLGITIDKRIIDFFTGKKNQTLEPKPELPKSLKYKQRLRTLSPPFDASQR